MRRHGGALSGRAALSRAAIPTVALSSSGYFASLTTIETTKAWPSAPSEIPRQAEHARLRAALESDVRPHRWVELDAGLIARSSPGPRPGSRASASRATIARAMSEGDANHSTVSIWRGAASARPKRGQRQRIQPGKQVTAACASPVVYAATSAGGATSFRAKSSRVVRNGRFRRPRWFPTRRARARRGPSQSLDEVIRGGVVADRDHLLRVVAK